MRLEGKSLKSDFLRFIIPSIIAQWVFSLYTMVDGIFVARGVSEVALTAVNISMPFTTGLFSVSILFAVGNSTIVAIFLGQGEKQKANEVCTLDPLPTAPRVAPDVNDGTWQSGIASAYSIETNDDGQGNFGVTNTASGIALTHQSVTVAVPEDKAYLVGSICEICYNGKVVIATVTDTGGFAKYGRALDLAPGVYKAFGANSYTDWGTRNVYYRFI